MTRHVFSSHALTVPFTFQSGIAIDAKEVVGSGDSRSMALTQFSIVQSVHEHRISAAKCQNAPWARIIKNLDESTGPLARPFARSLAPLTCGTVNDWMAICPAFFLFWTIVYD